MTAIVFRLDHSLKPGRVLGGGHWNHDSLLLTTVTFFGDHESFGTAVGEVGPQVLIDVRDDRLIKTHLVPFESQDTVGLARHDVLGDGRLSPHRDDRPLISTSFNSSGIAVPRYRGRGPSISRRSPPVPTSTRSPPRRGSPSAAPQPCGPIRTPTQRLAIHCIDRLSDARGRGRSRLHGL